MMACTTKSAYLLAQPLCSPARSLCCSGSHCVKHLDWQRFLTQLKLALLLEFFFRLLDEYGQPENGFLKFKPRDSKIMSWITYAYQTVKAVTDDSIASACKVILNIFHNSTMQKFGLPIVVEISQTSPLLSSYQSQPFEVINRKKYIQQIHTLMGEKVWDVELPARHIF